MLFFLLVKDLQLLAKMLNDNLPAFDVLFLCVLLGGMWVVVVNLL